MKSCLRTSILSPPGMENTGAHVGALVEFVDVAPTLADLAGLPLLAPLEGAGFKPLLAAPGRLSKSAVFSQYPRSQKGGRMGHPMRGHRYRFTVRVNRSDHKKVDAIELYDHQNVP